MSATAIAILLSGRGSNFLAIHRAISEGRLDAAIVAVISNRPDAPGLVKARELGLPSHLVDHRDSSDRDAHEDAIRQIIAASKAELIVLAGYMRLLSARFVGSYRHRIVNIHPSLLPSFPGTDAQQQALRHGVRITGCTVHLVDETLDGGPILVQRSVPVLGDDSEASLSARILEQEHEAYVEALQQLLRGEHRIEGRRVVFGGDPMKNLE